MTLVTRFLDGLFRLFVWLSGGIAAAVMALTFVGVIMRYVFRSPLSGGFELIEIGMGLIVFTALPFLIRGPGNIRVTVLFDKFAAPVQRIMNVISHLIGAALSGFMAWRVWLQGDRMLRYGEVTMELRIPKGLIAEAMAALLALAVVAFLLCAYEAWSGTDRRSPQEENPEPI